MNINNVLNLFLQQEYTVSEIELDHIDYLVMYMHEANAQLYISCPNSIEVFLKFRYLYDINGQGTMNHPVLALNSIDELKPFLDELFLKSQIMNSPFPENNLTSEREKIISLFKKILQKKTIPNEYSFNIEKKRNEASGVIKLIDKQNEKNYNLDLRKVDLGSLPKGVTSLIGSLRIYIDEFLLLGNNSQPSSIVNDKFSFLIPGYDLDKYTLLNTYNKLHKPHTNVNDWINELINSPNIEKGPINSGLQRLIMMDDLPENNSVKNRKPKI